jgi:hypothetical protein
MQLHQAVYKQGAVLRGERELEKASLRSSETCVHLQILICQYSYGWPGSRRQTSLQTSLQTSHQTTLPHPGRTAPFVHDILKGIMLRAVHRKSIASAHESSLWRLPGLAACTGTSAAGSAIHPEAWGNILMAVPQDRSITKVCIVYPLSLNTLS